MKPTYTRTRCYYPVAVMAGLSVKGPMARDVDIQPPTGTIGVIPVYTSLTELRKHFPETPVMTFEVDVLDATPDIDSGDDHGH